MPTTHECYTGVRRAPPTSRRHRASSYVLFSPSRNGLRIGLLGLGVRRPSPQTPPGQGRAAAVFRGSVAACAVPRVGLCRSWCRESACAGVSRLTPNLSQHALRTLPLRRHVFVGCVCVCCVSAPPVACPSAGMGTAQFPFRGADLRPKKGGDARLRTPVDSSTGVPDTPTPQNPSGPGGLKKNKICSQALGEARCRRTAGIIERRPGRA